MRTRGVTIPPFDKNVNESLRLMNQTSFQRQEIAWSQKTWRKFASLIENTFRRKHSSICTIDYRLAVRTYFLEPQKPVLE